MIRYRMLKFYVRYDMKINEVHSVISFKQSKMFEKYIDFSTQKEIKQRMTLKKISTNY